MCKECGGASICEHGRRRSQCKECGGGSICEHNRQRSRCKDCKLATQSIGEAEAPRAKKPHTAPRPALQPLTAGEANQGELDHHQLDHQLALELAELGSWREWAAGASQRESAPYVN